MLEKFAHKYHKKRQCIPLFKTDKLLQALAGSDSDLDVYITTRLSILIIPALIIGKDWLTTLSTAASAFFSSPVATRTKLV